MAETLGGRYFAALQRAALSHRRKRVCHLLLSVVFVIDGLAINLQESIKCYHFTLGNKYRIAEQSRRIFHRLAFYLDVHRGLFNLCICHLRGGCAFPDEVIKAALLSSSVNLGLFHISGADGFVGLLRSFGVGVITALLAVLLAIEFHNLNLAGVYAKVRQVHRVGTHVCNLTALVEMLGNHHGLADGES